MWQSNLSAVHRVCRPTHASACGLDARWHTEKKLLKHDLTIGRRSRSPRPTGTPATPGGEKQQRRRRAAVCRHPTGRERTGSPTTKTLQYPILHWTWLCLRAASKPLAKGNTIVRTCMGLRLSRGCPVALSRIGRFSSPVRNIVLLLREVLSSIRHPGPQPKKADWVWLWLSGGVRPQLGMSLRGHPISCFAAQSFFVYTGAQVGARVTSESTTITFFTPESTADTNGLVDFQVEMTNGACARARKHRALAWLWGSEIDGFPTLHGQPNRCFDDARCASSQQRRGLPPYPPAHQSQCIWQVHCPRSTFSLGCWR
jgi:hypothetical protein